MIHNNNVTSIVGHFAAAASTTSSILRDYLVRFVCIGGLSFKTSSSFSQERTLIIEQQESNNNKEVKVSERQAAVAFSQKQSIQELII
jgi:hypothetical protein